MSSFHEENNIMRPEKKFDDIIEEINEELGKAHRARKEGHCHIDDREFEQFKKGCFYNHWAHRFRRLGNEGVIDIPNTSLTEWIYWLYEWSEAFVDDYNKFKDLVFKAIKLHEERLNILDAQIKDLQIRVEEIERQLVLIWDEIHKLIQEVNNMKQEINGIHGDINNINNNITNINNRLDNLQNQINNIKQNAFNVSFGYDIPGVTTNGWHKMSNPDASIGILWDWNNSDDHNQGYHWQLSLNWLEIDNLTPQKMVGQEIGYIDLPSSLDSAFVDHFPGVTWLYSGYIVQGTGISSNIFLKITKEGRRVKVETTNYTHSSESASYGRGQLNNGGIPTLYALW